MSTAALAPARAAVHCGVGTDPLDVSAHLAAVAHPGAGAVAVFVGQVRDHAPPLPGEVLALEYSAHPDAGVVLDRIARRAAAPSGVLGLAVSHRIGRLGVGEVAVVAAVATCGREHAFQACKDLIDAVKAELPVWKRELRTDGSAAWVGLGDLAARSHRPTDS